MAKRPMLTVLAGGVGAARFLRGLIRVVDPAALTLVVNTGDDERFYGLAVSPDLDTITYTLAGASNPATGWGLRGDTFACLDALGRFHGPGWFRLGDRDLATHIYRTERLAAGAPLSTITSEIGRAFGVRSRILPMSDAPVRTRIHTARGVLSFQEYLVAQRARPVVRHIRYDGADRARPAPGVVAAIRDAATVLIAPSNPFLSIGPMLAVPGIRRALAARRGRVVAVAPLIGGRAPSGPLARLLARFRHPVSTVGIARVYQPLVDILAIDRRDRSDAPALRTLGVRAIPTGLLFTTPARAARAARDVLRAVGALA